MSSTMTVRLDDEIKARVEELAGATLRSKSFLAAEAIREVRAALREADAGNFADESDVKAAAVKWRADARQVAAQGASEPGRRGSPFRCR